MREGYLIIGAVEGKGRAGEGVVSKKGTSWVQCSLDAIYLYISICNNNEVIVEGYHAGMSEIF